MFYPASVYLSLRYSGDTKQSKRERDQLCHRVLMRNGTKRRSWNTLPGYSQQNNAAHAVTKVKGFTERAGLRPITPGVRRSVRFSCARGQGHAHSGRRPRHQHVTASARSWGPLHSCSREDIHVRWRRVWFPCRRQLNNTGTGGGFSSLRTVRAFGVRLPPKRA